MSVLDEYNRQSAARAIAVRHNNIVRMSGRGELVPLPPKVERPKVPVAYEPDGTYAGRLTDPSECPAGCRVRWEPALW